MFRACDNHGSSQSCAADDIASDIGRRAFQAIWCTLTFATVGWEILAPNWKSSHSCLARDDLNHGTSLWGRRLPLIIVIFRCGKQLYERAYPSVCSIFFPIRPSIHPSFHGFDRNALSRTHSRCAIWPAWAFLELIILAGLHERSVASKLRDQIASYKLSRFWQRKQKNRYRVILRKVSFVIFKIILVSKQEKSFTIESEGKGLSLSKFSWYSVIVKIIKTGHSKGHISQKNHDLKVIVMQE